MGNHHDSIALDWVRGEIEDTLTQGQQALEAYVENRDDSARLRFCLNYLHQVHGTLQMVELYGAALLTEEMEKLAQAILNDGVINVDDAIAVLMQAILQLPQYLEQLHSSRDDFPLVLLPLLNDLRAARGDSLLSDTSLFKPDLSAARFHPPASVSQRLQDPEVLGHIRKLRQIFQVALAGMIRETDLDAHFDYLEKAINRLIKLCQKTPREELWLAAGAFVDTLRSRDNVINTAVKSLLRQLDAELKRLLDEHVDILQQPVPESLFKHLLYYVARTSGPETRKVVTLRERYQLNDALPDAAGMDAARSRVSRPGREAIQAVVLALSEELAGIKDQLDLFVRAELRSNDELEELLPGLHQIANTLGVLGLGIPRQVVMEQVETVERLASSDDKADDGRLMDIAGALLYVEASLAGLEQERQNQRSGDASDSPAIGSHELNQASAAVLRESRNSLEQVKSAVVNFIASQWDESEIQHVPALLNSIQGGLKLVPLDRVADMLVATGRYITDVLLDGRQVPNWQQLDTLADVVSSIEYYLERLADGIHDNEAILKITEDSLRSLGFPVGENPTWSADTTSAAEEEGPEQTEAAPEATREADAELVDDEILEIFVEEAEEVVETIQTFYPRLRENHDDREALSEVRRAYHTLKGSGHLVGASSIGELAWSIENLLNLVIDKTIKPTGDMFTLVGTVNQRLPGLIDEFREGNVSGDVAGLTAQAEALATTRVSGEGAESVTAADTDETTEPSDASTPVAASEKVEDDLIDDEILEIFSEEAGEVLETIHDYLPMLLRQYDDRNALSEVRRAFHTLKGSGRMVGASAVGELAWSMENLLNRMMEGSVFMNVDAAQLLEEVVGVIPGLIRDFEQRSAPSLKTASLEARANAIADGEIMDAKTRPASASIDADLDATVAEDGVDPLLLEIFEAETETHLQALKDFLREAQGREATAYTDSLSRALHTLKGSAHTAAIAPIATIIVPLEKFIKSARAENYRAGPDVLALLEDGSQFVEAGIAQLRTTPQSLLPGTDDFLARLEAVAESTLASPADDRKQSAQADPQLLELFLSDGLDIVLEADTVLDAWAAEPGQSKPLETLIEELRRLALTTEKAGISDVAELADLLERTYGAVLSSNIHPQSDFFAIAHACQEMLINMLDQVAAGLATRPDGVLLAQLGEQREYFRREAEDAFSADLQALDASLNDEPAADTSASDNAEAPLPDTAIDAPAAALALGADQAPNTALDEELVDIFLGEGRDLIDSLGETLYKWADNPASGDLLTGAQRDLHTLKGGARLAEIAPVAALAHALEALLEGLCDNRPGVDDELTDLLLSSHDRLEIMVDDLAARQQPRPATDLIDEIQHHINTHAGSGNVAQPTSDDAEKPPITEPQMPEQATNHTFVDAGDAGETATPSAVAASMEPEPLDPELAEIFLEEAGEIILTTGDQLHQWQQNPQQTEWVEELQRHLHTLKGGARMAEITPVADIAHEMETLFERIVDGTLAPTEERTNLAILAHDQLATMVDAIAEHGLCPPAPEILEALQYVLTDRTAQADEPETGRTIAATEEKTTADAELEADATTAPEPLSIDELLVTEDPAAVGETAADEADDELVGIFLEEAHDLINATGSALHSWTENPGDRALAGELQRDVHTLKGSARMADIDAIGDLTHVLEDLFEELADGRRDATPAMNDLLFACHDRLAGMVETVGTRATCTPAHDLIAQVKAILADEPAGSGDVQVAADTDAENQAVIPEPDTRSPAPSAADADPALVDHDEALIGIFLDEGSEIHGAIRECLAQWRDDPEALIGITDLHQELHTLKGGARLADVDPVAELAEIWHDRLESVVADPAESAALLDLSEKAADDLKRMLTTLEEGAMPLANASLMDQFQQLAGDDALAPWAEGESGSGGRVDGLTGSKPKTIDAEMLEIFLEEAGELVDQLEARLGEWRQDPLNPHFNQEIQRTLHTLKGGARLAQLTGLGDLAHGFETRLIDLGGNAPDSATWDAINADHDVIVARISDIRTRFEGITSDTVVLAQIAPEPEIPTSVANPAEPTAPAASAASAAGDSGEQPVQQKPKPTPFQNRGAGRSAQETIRVSASLLDEMVNLAGETSITRSRLEQQSSDFSHTLDEMAATIERLREQLRRMDSETEAQILFRAEKDHGAEYGEDFDPLEMDRYSSIQQLSRALSESASDLADLRETMSDRTRDTETLLVQQSRINTELQEGLMKTRLIPFSSMVPRLRRIVRQISGELGKKVDFDVRNPEGEMDRNILERMIAPLEHMLRNAVDHGIETPSDRQTSNKPETGEVTLSLTREGGEVVLRLIDDGAGIDTDRIRKKAIKQGLLSDKEFLSDREILQFILQPGFSTAAEVTQISGRGVGMDVVASEIKQLGGSLDINSRLGHGTTFTVRLPFTVSVNRALMVSTGEDFYAIPLNTIEGIVRVSTYELEEYYRPGAPMYEYAGQEYRLQYLGSLLHSDYQPKLQGQPLPLPVILVRGAEQPIALQVDSLMGSREIVVKSLGPQFTSVRGVSGATILGDGSVVVILDLPAMIRSDILSGHQRADNSAAIQEFQRQDERPTRVMVVDDSVTVRKVTSRLLERNGMEVILAKDGLDAVAQLQDHRPDVILLDIEMPRMDGFEVANFIRHDDNLSATPICMITSRTGQKHRDRALAIGVNEYLGKPFQETDLLGTIDRLTRGT